MVRPICVTASIIWAFLSISLWADESGVVAEVEGKQLKIETDSS